MWYPVSDSIVAEPVSTADAQAQAFEDQDEFETSIEMLIASARAHVEAYCNQLFAAHTMTWECDGFGDFARLPAAPAVSVSEIRYRDMEGEPQVVDPAVYSLRPDYPAPRIILKRGHAWPRIEAGSRVAIDGAFGGMCPPDVKHAMLLLIGDGFTARANGARPAWTAVDALLANHRRGAW